MKKILKMSGLILGLSLLPHAQAYEKNKTYRFTVLHVNDTHGRFWHNDKGEYGFPAQKTVIEQIKKEVKKQGGSVILLHAGDVNTGVPESDIQNARPDIEALNNMGYEAMTVGNHEFDNPFSALKNQQKWAKFPFLSANVVWQNSGKFVAQPYTILHKNGLKIAVVGLTTEETATAGNPLHTNGVVFKNVPESAQKILAKIRKQHAPDVKIALTHLGYENANPNSPATSDVQLAQRLPAKSFDMIIGGHSHTLVCMENGKLKTPFQAGDKCQPDLKNGTWIMQAGEWGKYLGRADFEFKNGKTKLLNYQLIPINLKKKITSDDGKTQYQFHQSEIAPEPKLRQLLQHYQDKANAQLSESVAQIQGEFDGKRETVRHQQSALAHLIAQAQKERVNADLVVVNGGGIRASLPNGTISYKDILTVQPFGNVVSYVDLTGAELHAYLQEVAQYQAGEGGYAQFSANVSMTVKRAEKTIDHVQIDGKPLDLQKTYRLAVVDFLALGGDGYPKLNQHPSYINTGLVDADTLKHFLQQRKTVDVRDFEPKNEIVYQ
ncbi:bifunctional UDP-sugar hydrolase/5'-nucleotidase UshA [Alysiella filiformis]|uniref:5'-nucleotidase / UDP-sugar diphosphatase n=1 Tax=Alysiella filiformis DSM 16848 TaxID=1120981 RepID=A0A286EE23_9NEIS|nr:bifunctional UDP-sugar hydrolase/5'-nucleotidase UshA [Alysiella filiformis]QMT30931.1 bifunctional UDP-sugar hydrolase/5'-nucleotidase [Alysiella filiformis]UBQ56082.1 bifunctional UDP-sugar hydrolase/5'-nucleotidase UshA [Alysiella filiformis DSM 16848]SOD69158.1 5'-nucleotidase / UDP-sugar diphosphatase [Alysiella filiformis DSM 16848]